MQPACYTPSERPLQHTQTPGRGTASSGAGPCSTPKPHMQSAQSVHRSLYPQLPCCSVSLGIVQVSLILFTNVFDNYVSGFEEVLIEPQYVIVGMLFTFALVHSGLAYLRPYGVTQWHVLDTGTYLLVSEVPNKFDQDLLVEHLDLWAIQRRPHI
jgi:hypothetical protein